nr:hypothetical protein [Salmonella enterica]
MGKFDLFAHAIVHHLYDDPMRIGINTGNSKTWLIDIGQVIACHPRIILRKQGNHRR